MVRTFRDIEVQICPLAWFNVTKQGKNGIEYMQMRMQMAINNETALVLWTQEAQANTPSLLALLPLLKERKGWNHGVSNYSPRYQISTIFRP